jgi:hypothetical protein
LRIQQRGQCAQDAAFRLSAQTEQNEIVPRENRVHNLRDDCVVVANDARKHRNIVPEAGHQVVAEFVLHPARAQFVF